MPDEKQVNSLAIRTVEEERALLEKQRLRTERKELRKAERAAKVAMLVDRVIHTAAKQVDLKQHVFKSDEELQAIGLKPHEIAIVRQWQEAKRNAAFAVESSSRLIEARTRASSEKQTVKVNVQNMIVLPQKEAVTVAPVVIDVDPGDK